MVFQFKRVHALVFGAALAPLSFGCSVVQAQTISQRGSLLFSPHCLEGCPVGGPSTNRLIHRQSNVLSNNGLTKFADWVVYMVSPATFGPSRGRFWRLDPAIPAAEALGPDDYRGANAGLKTDGGHQAPLASFAGAAARHKTNYLSNITPQKSALN
jgi:endonuclease G